jgi:Zn-dependent M28 family amino/carboxypeptidase
VRPAEKPDVGYDYYSYFYRKMRENHPMRTTMARAFRVFSLLLLSVLSLTMLVPVALADDIHQTQGFRQQVTLAGIREHQAAFQAHSDANGGNRAAGTTGYDASAQYVYDRAVAAGYNVSFQEFTFPFVGDNTPPVFQRTSAPPKTYVDGIDYGSMQFSGSGDVTAALVAVDLVVPPVGAANGNTSGCEAADFIGFPVGAIALIQRGTCTFRAKAENAKTAGASAVVIFNEGQPGRTTGAFGTLSAPPFDRPVLSASFAAGDELRNGVLNGPTGVTVRVRVDTIVATRTTRNVIAETPYGDPDHVIVVGAHLDSVTRGPGINDNGSGSATILEIAEQLGAHRHGIKNKVRFAWWGAEELGLIGSTFYVNNLSPAELAKIELNLNFDMVGSPNFVRFVYDGDNSAFPVGPGAADGPPGSGAIELVFHSYFASQNLVSAETPFSGRSDYGPFIAVGIPAGGLFTGAEGIKTPAEAALYGGTAGDPYDPCYHLACDTFANNNNTGLDQMSDATAHTVLLLARQKFDKDPLVDPSAPVTGSNGGGGGGGLHDDHDNLVDR